ncbi:DUF1798 family protein [Oceanobacillus piezotolerans]|uniref:DUF1798 family protein n=1 Tax=Oceanobacillus piezotolerans TaxID=2448030 RepID=A0A498DGC4_9BACI|nr:DUF1798 family protein [Oceanobacillus piezotolerans]RLL48238.1 DUF1798 family protein [Oceanobacillus piezotolerans]
MEVINQTEQLLKHLHLLRERFEIETPPENLKDRDFFQKVKQETSPIYDLIAAWEEAALIAVKTREVTVHPHQVTSTRENMELLLMHSYYKDVRRRRYMEYYKSIQYIFEQLLHDLK